MLSNKTIIPREKKTKKTKFDEQTVLSSPNPKTMHNHNISPNPKNVKVNPWYSVHVMMGRASVFIKKMTLEKILFQITCFRSLLFPVSWC